MLVDFWTFACINCQHVLPSVTLLRIRNRVYRRICEQEDADTDQDGIPDIYQSKPP